MFAIYGSSGPIYQGTLENLPRISPVSRSGAVNAVRRVGDQIEEVALAADSGASEASALGGQAVEAYKACLLYTSPSPRDRTRSRMPSSA